MVDNMVDVAINTTVDAMVAHHTHRKRVYVVPYFREAHTHAQHAAVAKQGAPTKHQRGWQARRGAG